MIALNHILSFGNETEPTTAQLRAIAQQRAEAEMLWHRDTVGYGRAATAYPASPLPADAFWRGTLEVDEELTLTLEALLTTAVNEAAHNIFRDPPSRRTPLMPSPARTWKTPCKPLVGDASAPRLSWPRPASPAASAPGGGAPPSDSAAAPADLGAGHDASLFHARHPRTTAYGETPDCNSSDGIGAWVSTAEAACIRAGEPSEMRLRPGGLAVSRDIEAQFREQGIRFGDPVTLNYAVGTTHTGRLMDRTDGSLDGSLDLYSPDGPPPTTAAGSRIHRRWTARRPGAPPNVDAPLAIAGEAGPLASLATSCLPDSKSISLFSLSLPCPWPAAPVAALL